MVQRKRLLCFLIMALFFLSSQVLLFATQEGTLSVFEQEILWDRRGNGEDLIMVQRALYLANSMDSEVRASVRVPVTCNSQDLDLQTLFPLLTDWVPKQMIMFPFVEMDRPTFNNPIAEGSASLTWNVQIPEHSTGILYYSQPYSSDTTYVTASLPWVNLFAQLERPPGSISITLGIENKSTAVLDALQIAFFLPYAVQESGRDSFEEVLHLAAWDLDGFSSIITDTVGIDGSLELSRGAYLTGPAVVLQTESSLRRSAIFTVSNKGNVSACLHPFVELQFRTPIMVDDLPAFEVSTTSGGSLSELGGQLYCNIGLPLGLTICYPNR